MLGAVSSPQALLPRPVESGLFASGSPAGHGGGGRGAAEPAAYDDTNAAAAVRSHTHARAEPILVEAAGGRSIRGLGVRCTVRGGVGRAAGRWP
jgi:hypothetical protein